MATYEITSPTGETFEITAPDGASEADVMAYAQQSFSQQAPAPPQEPQQPAEQQTAPPVAAPPETMRGGRLDGLLTGLRDPIDAMAQYAPRLASAYTSFGGFNPNPVSRFFDEQAKGVDQMVQGNDAEYQAARQAQGREGLDAMRLGGNVVSAAIPAGGAANITAKGVGLLGARPLAARAAGGMSAGAATGVLTPTSSDDFAGEKASQGLMGAALGPVAEVLGAGAGKLLEPAKREGQKLLMREGVTLTPGQFYGGIAKSMEDKAMSIPLLGDAIKSARMKGDAELNRAVANRALAPVGKSLPKNVDVGNDAAAYVRKTLSNEYDSLLPSLQFTPDTQYAGELRNIIGMTQSPAFAKSDQFMGILKQRLFDKITPQGNMNGETFKLVEQGLSQEAKKYLRAMDPDQRSLGEALREVLTSTRQALGRSNPQQAEKLRKINEGYANYAKMRQASSSVAADGGVFSPAQLHSAVKSGDSTVGKRAFSEGDALMQDLSAAAKGVMQSKYPDSGTTGRLLMTGGLLGGATVNPLIPAAASLSALPYLAGGRQATQGLLKGAEKLSKGSSRLLSKRGKLALPLLLSPTLEARE